MINNKGFGSDITLPKPLLLYIAHLAHLVDIDELEARMDFYDECDKIGAGMHLAPSWIRLDAHNVPYVCRRPRCKYRRLYHELKKWIK